MSTSRPVLVLKEPRSADGEDPYATEIERRGFGPVRMIGVLEHTLDNLDALAEIVRGRQSAYAGVIVTSQRAVEAWARAAAAHMWTDAPFYAVATATARALVEAGVPRASIHGAEEAGTGERLASYMVDRLRADPPCRPLLYLVGDKRRDTVARALAEAGITVQELQVYSTRIRSDFPSLFEPALVDALATDRHVWLALFSPSGASAVLPIVRKLGALERIRLAAIGPTTRDALVDDHGLSPHAVASSPGAAALAEAMVAAEASDDVCISSHR